MFKTLCRSLDALVSVAQAHGGMLPSIIDRATRQMPDSLPPAIPGQRDGDRAFPGTNLMHDIPLLELCFSLPASVERATTLSTFADRLVKRFAEHCTNTPTGLFPWGEHAFWDLRKDAVGNSLDLIGGGPKPWLIHDHLRRVPTWLWHKLHEANPDCVRRFADGLDYHWRGGIAHPLEYCRHAFISPRAYMGRGDEDSCDFPRHGGFYILDWAFAYARFRDDEFLQQLMRMADYWRQRRDDTGLCLMETRSTRAPNSRTVLQTLSLALSLWDAAELLTESQPEVALELRKDVWVYTGGVCTAPHCPDEGLFVNRLDGETRKPTSSLMPWGSRYGQSSSAQFGCECLALHQRTDDPRLLALAEAAAAYAAHTPHRSDVPIPARDVGLQLQILAGLRATVPGSWHETALSELAEWACATYLDTDLPRGASTVDWYEAQLGTGDLLLGLAMAATR